MPIVPQRANSALISFNIVGLPCVLFGYGIKMNKLKVKGRKGVRAALGIHGRCHMEHIIDAP